MKKKLTTQPRVEDQRYYRKIGKLKKSVADAIGKECTNIYISDNHLKHIFIKHKNEIAQVGLTPLAFVDLVVGKYNRIYKGRRSALQLVVWNGSAKVVIIELNLALENNFYEVVTATIKRKSNLKDHDLLWKKK